MQCPHCSQHIYSKPRHVDLGACGDGNWSVSLEACPNCGDAIIHLSRLPFVGCRTYTLIYPKGTTRGPMPKEVPDDIARDYEEAALLLQDSPQASAALARSCLRKVLHHFGFRDA